MSITDNFNEELYRDMDFINHIQQRRKDQIEEQDLMSSIEEQAYEIMCQEYFKIKEQYDNSMMNKEYRSIKEWEEIKNN